ncbi:hypothetical protein HYW67_02585 [Candidatus Parcubacteria bacterium]|nr:hypothetical protein [Candidatus Parcubacteria bacterium]
MAEVTVDTSAAYSLSFRNAMQLNTKAFAYASATVMGAVDIVCALVSLLAPDLALKLFGWLAHLVNVERLADGASITFGGLIAGFVQAVVYGFLVGWIFAWTYNRFAANKA